MSESSVTALIPAYNAQYTIERALRSVVTQVGEVIVFDDGSSDDTAARVTRFPADNVRLIQCEANQGIGLARQRLIEACSTDHAMWLDSDDEVLPGRVDDLLIQINRGAEWVFDAAELYDGETKQRVRALPIPAFVTRPGALAHQFARNYLPTLGGPLVLVRAARNIGYRPEFRQAEDYDHFLRALVAGHHIHCSPRIGYRQYHYGDSVSRAIETQAQYAVKALASVGVPNIHRILSQGDLSEDETRLIRYYVLARLCRWHALDQLLADAAPKTFDQYFFTGVAAYYTGHLEASKLAFQACRAFRDSADIHNNLGVIWASVHQRGSHTLFKIAVDRQPNYRDALHNLSLPEGTNSEQFKLTRFPLRTNASRDSYP